MDKAFLYIAILFLTALASFQVLYKNNDTYINMLENKNIIFNFLADKGTSEKNIFQLMKEYIDQDKRTKVFLVPSLEIYKSEFINEIHKHKGDLYFIIITGNVAAAEDYTNTIKDYNINKYNILNKINLDSSDIYGFIGYKGFIKEIKIK